MQGEMGNTLNAITSDASAVPMEVDGTNGYCLNGKYFPEEVLILILSHVEPMQFLNCKLVCKLWNQIIKSRMFWHEICRRNHMQPKSLPWWLYYTKFATNFFDTNLIKNGNGQNKFEDWVIKPIFSGDGFCIEEEPQGSQQLPENVEDFNGYRSCFATSFSQCSKQQILKFKSSPLRKFILDKYKPKLIASEWIAPRFDCSSRYSLYIRVVQTNKKCVTFDKNVLYEQWTEGIWEKITLEIQDYPDDVDYIVFQHEGQDQLYWQGHYGIKMAGASLKIIFDSIEDEPRESTQE